jgi:predicted metal-dependent hydrolase
MLSIRESQRARQLILQALPPRTIELVVPKGMRAKAIQAFIREHRDWIDRAGSELILAYPESTLRPATIMLAAVGARINVRYLGAAALDARYRYARETLSLYCRRDDASDAPALLRRWLLAQAARILKPWLAREAERTGLRPAKVQVRLQKTRWGSCSVQGSISVNAALLLVAPELVRYLFVHELCHLRHLSHSSRYWRAVAAHEPEYRELDRRLAASWRQLPAWVMALTHGDIAC